MEINVVKQIWPSSGPREVTEPLGESAKILFGDIEVFAEGDYMAIRSRDGDLIIKPCTANKIYIATEDF